MKGYEMATHILMHALPWPDTEWSTSGRTEGAPPSFQQPKEDAEIFGGAWIAGNMQNRHYGVKFFHIAHFIVHIHVPVKWPRGLTSLKELDK